LFVVVVVVVVAAEIKENIISDLNFKDRLPVESSSIAVVVVVD